MKGILFQEDTAPAHKSVVVMAAMHNCAVAELEGGAKKIIIDYVFLIPFCISMFKSKAQIAQESINNSESFQGNFHCSNLVHL